MYSDSNISDNVKGNIVVQKHYEHGTGSMKSVRSCNWVVYPHIDLAKAFANKPEFTCMSDMNTYLRNYQQAHWPGNTLVFMKHKDTQKIVLGRTTLSMAEVRSWLTMCPAEMQGEIVDGWYVCHYPKSVMLEAGLTDTPVSSEEPGEKKYSLTEFAMNLVRGQMFRIATGSFMVNMEAAMEIYQTPAPEAVSPIPYHWIYDSGRRMDNLEELLDLISRVAKTPIYVMTNVYGDRDTTACAMRTTSIFDVTGSRVELTRTGAPTEYRIYSGHDCIDFTMVDNSFVIWLLSRKETDINDIVRYQHQQMMDRKASVDVDGLRRGHRDQVGYRERSSLRGTVITSSLP